MHMITFIAGFVLGAVAGLLFGRRNKQKVEAAYSAARAIEKDLEAKVKNPH
jgi:type II secretory pathway pseudopilin PulG